MKSFLSFTCSIHDFPFQHWSYQREFIRRYLEAILTKQDTDSTDWIELLNQHWVMTDTDIQKQISFYLCCGEVSCQEGAEMFLYNVFQLWFFRWSSLYKSVADNCRRYKLFRHTETYWVESFLLHKTGELHSGTFIYYFFFWWGCSRRAQSLNQFCFFGIALE